MATGCAEASVGTGGDEKPVRADQVVLDHFGGSTGVAALSPASGTLDLLVPDEELETRRAALPVPAPAPATGYRRHFHEHVLGADRGCDFDFCVPPADD